MDRIYVCCLGILCAYRITSLLSSEGTGVIAPALACKVCFFKYSRSDLHMRLLLRANPFALLIVYVVFSGLTMDASESVCMQYFAPYNLLA